MTTSIQVATSSIKGKPPTVVVEAQGRLFRAKVLLPSGTPHTRGPRGRVAHFSRASRKRLLDSIARLDPQPLPGSRTRAVFLTLTTQAVHTPVKLKQYLDTWWKRVARRHPRASATWRMEPQKRGAPHLHLMVYNLPYWDKRDVQRTWGEVVGEDRPFTRIEAVRTLTGVMAYCAKYMAKPTDVIDANADVSEDGQDGGQLSGSSGLDSLTYLTGRCWGHLGRSRLPWAPVHLVTLSLERLGWWLRLKRLGRRRWRGVSRHLLRGFSLYCVASEWFAATSWCVTHT
jgi:hypothetical protein